MCVSLQIFMKRFITNCNVLWQRHREQHFQIKNEKKTLIFINFTTTKQNVGFQKINFKKRP